MADIATVTESSRARRFSEFLPKDMITGLNDKMSRKTVKIGLDIGSSAVRAAEVAATQSGGEVRRFGQVGLPAGAVVEGEVRDEATVAEAIRRLWSECGFSKKEVVVGISSQRAMVRQLEMPEMNDAELGSALRYEIGELLPIPVEQAVFDFAVLGPETHDRPGENHSGPGRSGTARYRLGLDKRGAPSGAAGPRGRLFAIGDAEGGTPT